MNVQRIKSSRPQVLIAVRNVCRTQNDVTCFSIDRHVADSEFELGPPTCRQTTPPDRLVTQYSA